MIGIALLVLLAITAAFTQKVNAQVNVSVSFQTFYDELSPYGQWVSDPQYGNVWVPNAGTGFRPYGTNGYWVMTEYGNTWVSSYPWGWAPFHYGRWTYDPFYGWVWIPGYEWGPAWVSWRSGGGYYGWAPMGPGITVGMAVGRYSCPADWWVFVTPQYLYHRNYYRYRRGPRYNTVIINQTTIINNTYRDNHSRTNYVIGPRASTIRNVTNRPVPTYRLQQAPRPGAASVSGNSVALYRPTVNRSTVRTATPRNAVRAPQAVGKPQPVSSNRQPAFQNTQRQQQSRPATNQSSSPVQRTAPGRSEPRQIQRQPGMNTPEPRRIERQQVNPQMRPNASRPEPRRIERQQSPQQNMNRPQPRQMQHQPMSRPQPRQNMSRPATQQPAARPAPNTNRPTPQSHPQQRGGGFERR